MHMLLWQKKVLPVQGAAGREGAAENAKHTDGGFTRAVQSRATPSPSRNTPRTTHSGTAASPLRDRASQLLLTAPERPPPTQGRHEQSRGTDIQPGHFQTVRRKRGRGRGARGPAQGGNGHWCGPWHRAGTQGGNGHWCGPGAGRERALVRARRSEQHAAPQKRTRAPT